MSVFSEIYRKLSALQVVLAQLPADPEAERAAVALEFRAERQVDELMKALLEATRQSAGSKDA
jgi:hypothetical protein